MNHRVLELLKTPKNIQSEDLDLLKEEINSFPYIQNIRALYLYGVHLHDKENYQKALSTTAAYTTDKKILYQLINGKIQQKPKPEIPREIVKEKVIPTENPLKILYQAKATGFPLKREENQNVEAPPKVIEDLATDKKEGSCILQTPRPEVKHIYVNGERNRILFEGEENFLDDENAETIDLESTLESGSIVTQKIEKKGETFAGTQDEKIVDEIEEFTPETIIEQEKITSEPEKEEILDESQLSFHETESFMVQIEKNEEPETVVDQIENLDVNKIEGTAEFTPEKIINEDQISSKEEQKSVRDDEELSFHGMESFLPEVKIQANSEDIKSEISRPGINKHEEEMRRLIEEVEKKMKEKAASQENDKKEEEPENTGHDISFAETQSFEVKPTEPEEKEEIKHETQLEVQPETQKESKEEVGAEEPAEIKSTWKPMSFESNLPDSLLKPMETVVQPKGVEVPETEISEKEILKQEDILPEIEEIPELVKDQSEKFGKPAEELQIDEETPVVEKIDEKREEVPVMNVSFFGSDISKWTTTEDKKEEAEQETAIVKKASDEGIKPNPIDSNIPGFINTWQSWLKIDRSTEIEKEKAEIKTKAIETFIENNPKISQLKEESNFIVKEKNDDISHLMTETLANLYFEQKLYTKAIKAFEILIKKTPEKKEYYEGRIQEIKDFKSKS